MADFLANMGELVASGHVLAYVAAFAGGLLTAASPCVLAAIPLVIGYVGGYSDGNTKKAAMYSLSFVTGMTITFTVLGIGASVLGRLLAGTGFWMTSALVLVCVVMGLQLLGLFRMPDPGLGRLKNRTVGVSGIAGAFILGLLTGAVSSPCATPVLAVILTHAATEGDYLYGGSLLFVYAVAHCLLLFAAGVSVGWAEKIAGSRHIERFNLYARRLAGLVLIGTGFYLGLGISGA